MTRYRPSLRSLRGNNKAQAVWNGVKGDEIHCRACLRLTYNLSMRSCDAMLEGLDMHKAVQDLKELDSAFDVIGSIRASDIWSSPSKQGAFQDDAGHV